MTIKRLYTFFQIFSIIILAKKCEKRNWRNPRLLIQYSGQRVENLAKSIFPNTSNENCTFTVCFETGKWLISQQLLFSRLKTDGESTIVTKLVGKNNMFHSWRTTECQLLVFSTYQANSYQIKLIHIVNTKFNLILGHISHAYPARPFEVIPFSGVLRRIFRNIDFFESVKFIVIKLRENRIHRKNNIYLI